MSADQLMENRVDVSRFTSNVVDGVLQESWATAFSNMRCRVGPIPARERDSIIGRIAGARYKMWWGTQALLDGDRVTYNGQKFILKEIKHDDNRRTLRQQTGILDTGDFQ